MAYPERYAILLDGAFVIKKLQPILGHFPKADDVEALCERIKTDSAFKSWELLRIYFYHARPATGTLRHPVNGSRLVLDDSTTARNHNSLLDTLELKPDFALRLGETTSHNWRLTPAGLGAITQAHGQAVQLQANHLVPNITQKGVDLRLGLDMARLALDQMVRAVVVVTGDSDCVPAFKFARREGIRVYLCHLGHGVRRELKAHADVILSNNMLPKPQATTPVAPAKAAPAAPAQKGSKTRI